MTYAEALEYLATLNTFGIQLGLTRIERLLELMHHPERRFKTIHVTGTNGKGSTTAVLASILTASGIKTGMYTSPHLADYTERMVVNGQAISREQMAHAIEYTRTFVDCMVKEGGEHPTEFEVLTAAAFYYFAACGVEYAVIEVGLGGLLDSTNVIIPQISVITNVTVEHTDRCGSTIAEIAHHKAGIIKPAVPVVTAAKGEALAIIKQTAAANGCQAFVMGRDFSAEWQGAKEYRQQIAVTLPDKSEASVYTTLLLGRHQVENCAVAVMAATALAPGESRIMPATIAAGMAAATWPGRFELIQGQPTIVIDGAHNPDGARVLRQGLQDFFPGRKLTFVLGILRDKDVTGIIRELIRYEDTVIVVMPLSERAAEAQEIAREIKTVFVETAPTIAAGIERAKDLAGPAGLVCIAGSLYLIGAARQIVCS